MIKETEFSNMGIKTAAIILVCLALLFSVLITITGAGKVEAASSKKIYTAEDLSNIRHDLEADYILQNDIDLDVAPYNTGQGWVPIDSGFNGTFDGNGKKIKGLMIDKGGTNALFLYGGHTSKFLNVTLEDVDITSSSANATAGLVASLGRHGLIENVHVTGKISGGDKVGGVVGDMSNSKIKDSTADVTITSRSRAGGLVGTSGGEEATIENSTSKGSISSIGRGVGGLVGEGSNIINSSSSAKVTSTHNGNESNIGGLVGYLYTFSGQITDSYATGDVQATNGQNIGGLVGLIKSSTTAPVTNSYATGTVTGNNNVGGLVGNNNGVVISGSYANGEVFGKDDVGGLIGYHHHGDGVIEKSYSESTVIATGNNVGGLVGSTKDASQIIDTYARGKVKGKDNVGGLVGFNPSSTIHRSYATGKITGQDKLGGLVGSDVHGKYASNAPNYFDKQTTTMTNAVGATGDTTVNMQTRSTFKGWNFTSTWRLNKNDYPILRDGAFEELTDVPSSHWGRDHITEIFETGIMSGSPDLNNPGKFTFKPADQITRAEFAIVIVNALGETATSSSTGFKDDSTIPVWAKKEVAKAKELGIVKGDEKSRFNPSKKISRAEIATMIARAYQLGASQGQLSNFVDKSSIPSWAKAEIEAVVANGIMEGQDQSGKIYFAPGSQAQRVEAGVSALRAYKID